MEAACKAASRTAQLLTKDTPQEEVSQMMAVMASIKEQLSKVCMSLYSMKLYTGLTSRLSLFECACMCIPWIYKENWMQRFVHSYEIC